jgi:hypothetical protein
MRFVASYLGVFGRFWRRRSRAAAIGDDTNKVFRKCNCGPRWRSVDCDDELGPHRPICRDCCSWCGGRLHAADAPVPPCSESLNAPRCEHARGRLRTPTVGDGLSALVVPGVLGFASYRLLMVANQVIADSDGPTVFRLPPTKALWIFLPLFGAISLSWGFTLFLFSLTGERDRIARYVEWGNQRVGFDAGRALRWMALVLVLPIGVATLLAVPMHSSLHDDDVVIREYAALSSRRYRSSQARRLSWVDGFRSRDGRFAKRGEILIDFSDGYRWSSAANRDFESLPDPGLVEFLRSKTGLPIKRAQTERDLPTF